jgi:transcriptional regulator with XRE-family HTH domain
MSIGENLKIARGTLGLSQKDMAKAINVSLTALQNYESGHQAPGAKVFESMFRLGFNANWILTGEGDMKRQEDIPICRNNMAEYERQRAIRECGDPELAEIVDILRYDLPEDKRFVLKVLRGRKEAKEGLEGLGLKIKE